MGSFILDRGTWIPQYLKAALRLSRRMLEIVGSNPRLSATAIQTVGSKGYDGMLMARVE